MVFKMEPSDADDGARSEATISFTVDNFSTVSEMILSPPTFVQNLPWKILILPRQTIKGAAKSLGYFLQCNSQSKSSSWRCLASAELRVKNRQMDKDFTRKISHLFSSEKNDWGFSYFMSWDKVVDPDEGFVQDDGSVTFEVKVTAEAPVGVKNSRKNTAFVGLKKRGVTSPFNSLLQVPELSL